MCILDCICRGNEGLSGAEACAHLPEECGETLLKDGGGIEARVHGLLGEAYGLVLIEDKDGVAKALQVLLAHCDRF